MKRYSVPGVYIEPAPKKIAPIKMTIKCLTGFIGLAEKGPLHKSVKITHFKEFSDIFGGFTNYSYLAYAVFGYFNCGGKECIVVRTAHLAKNQPDLKSQGETEDQKNAAQKAFLIIKGPENQDVLKISATSEGMWGDRIQVKLWYASEVSTKITRPIKTGSNVLSLESTAEMYPGDVVCIYNTHKREYRKITSITEDTITITSPLKHDYTKEKEPLFCEKVLINLMVLDKKHVEEYLYLSLNHNDTNYYIKEVNTQSQLIECSELNYNNDQDIPGEVFFKNLNHGKNGILGLTPADFIGYFKGLEMYKGIGIFESFEDMSLIVCPDLLVFQELVYSEKDKNRALDAIHAVQLAMINQCERLGNRFAILDCPILDNPIHLLKWRDRFDTKYAAIYYPRIEMINPGDIRGLSSLFIPPSGHLAGSYVDCDANEGIYRAPANKLISGIVGLERIIEKEEYEILYPRGINCMRYLPGKGVKAWGARTLSSDPMWRFINIRRTFSAIRDSLRGGAGWAVFEPNTPGLRKRLIRHVSAFLLDLWRKGYMMGNTPEAGFYVRCDDELNPPENIDKGIIQMEVGLSIARPAEFLIVKLTANKEDSIVFIDE
ncbi:MAG: phage tail sheath family protein [Spirochaetales bacterium]|nr:phage tail sheath family protein [Spirochaetales bacterium]